MAKVLLIIYDNGSHIHIFPMGSAYIASVLREAGHEVVIYSQDQYHYPESHLTEYLNRNHFDVVGLGIQGGYYQYKKLLSISDSINRSRERPLYILGGHCASPEPEYFLKKTHADIVVIGEGERTIIELLEAVSSGISLRLVKGIAFIQQNQCIITGKRETIQDLNSIPYPAWDLFPMDYYSLVRIPRTTITDRVAVVLSGRDCPYSCNFCYRMTRGYRPRSAESIIEEIKILKKDYQITFIDFLDDLLMTSPNRAILLSEAFIGAHLKIKWSCNGRLNFATPEVLDTMKRSGCVFINYGIESLDDNMLKVMDKKLTVEQITRGVEATLAAGISPGLNIIWGNKGETKEILQKGVEFLLRYDDHVQLRTIRFVTPYPGSELYYYAIRKGLLGGVEDFYEHKHKNSDLLTINFTDMTDAEANLALCNANIILLNNYYKSQLGDMITKTKKLYLEGDASFRGYRRT